MYEYVCTAHAFKTDFFCIFFKQIFLNCRSPSKKSLKFTNLIHLGCLSILHRAWHIVGD